MENVVFVVNEAPYCVWGNRLREDNLNFLKNIDPTIFERFANSQFKELEADPSPQSAVQLRLSYGIAVEALLSFLAATIQAPLCVFGWLSRCRPGELVQIVEKIKHERNVLNMFGREYFNWKEISKLVFSEIDLPDQSKRDRIIVRFGELWRNFADDFLDSRSKGEFNSIKHGMRINPGPVRVSIGLQRTKDTPCPIEEMQKVCDSSYGSTFMELIEFNGGSHNYRVRSRTSVWTPENYFHGISFIKYSLNNILGFLRIVNGCDPAEVTYIFPEDESEFESPWRISQGLNGIDEPESFNEEDVKALGKAEILSAYKKISEKVGLRQDSAS